MTQFSAPWPHLSLISILDILLVAIVIYEFLALVRGTRAAVMLVGVAALVLAFYFSRLGELTTLNWLISTLLPYAVFALIVVFQAEIRQGLARLGRRLTLSRTPASEADAYDDIVLAANLFAQNQTGALMVIEREVGLRTYIESGVHESSVIHPAWHTPSRRNRRDGRDRRYRGDRLRRKWRDQPGGGRTHRA